MQRTICEKNRITPKTVIEIHNALRLLGLRGSSKGTILINKAIQIIIKNDYEYVVIKDIYKKYHTRFFYAHLELYFFLFIITNNLCGNYLQMKRIFCK